MLRHPAAEIDGRGEGDGVCEFDSAGGEAPAHDVVPEEGKEGVVGGGCWFVCRGGGRGGFQCCDCGGGDVVEAVCWGCCGGRWLGGDGGEQA